MREQRRSSIDTLPAEARDALEGWLRDPGVKQREAMRRVNALLEEMGLGEQRVSKQAVHRHTLRMRSKEERSRQAEVIAGVWVEKLGVAPGGQAGGVVIEMLRLLTFEIALRLLDGELDNKGLRDVVDAAGKVCEMVERLERSREIAARGERR